MGERGGHYTKCKKPGTEDIHCTIFIICGIQKQPNSYEQSRMVIVRDQGEEEMGRPWTVGTNFSYKTKTNADDQRYIRLVMNVSSFLCCNHYKM